MEPTTVPGRKLREWRSKVYRAKDPDADFYDSPEWRELRRSVFERDHFRCQRCLLGRKRDLTCHHIMPVTDGGSDDRSNLITLCERCHTIVEADPLLRTAQLIKNSMYEDTMLPTGSTRGAVDLANQPTWHAWVYGGEKNPNI